VNRAVIDASVVLKWYLADEDLGSQALLVLEKFLSGELALVAPSLIEYEVMNGLVIAQRKGRISDRIIHQAGEGFLSLSIEQMALSNFISEALHFCRVYHRSLYDASYLALAKKEDIPLITADKELYNTIRKNFRQLKWLGDIQ
jgi:predicted nucleic acid-binding protein